MITFLYTLLFASCIFKQGATSDSIPVKGYTLYWNDEFSNSAVSLSKWNYRALGKRDDAFNTKEAVRLDGKGNLVIDVYQRNDSVFTGMVSTENIFETQYGYFECRVRLTHTPGTFPSFWLQSRTINEVNSRPETHGAELDIFEYYPHATKDFVSHAMHWGGYGAAHRAEQPIWGKLDHTADDFHTIGLEWTDTSYTTFVDGKKTFTGNKLISKVPQFMILSLGINQQAAGPLSYKDLPDQFIVDYVRVYKKSR